MGKRNRKRVGEENYYGLRSRVGIIQLTVDDFSLFIGWLN
jgi:hypothetical protein